MAKTNIEKQNERRAELESLARALGFENYSALATYLKNSHSRGEPIKIVVGRQVFKAQPSQARPPRA